MAQKKNREMKATKIEIIPMIDTMFFLLVFFILSSVGVIKLRGINIDLPQASGAPPPPDVKHPKHADLVVTIMGNRKIFVNKTEVTGHPPNIGPVLEREMRKALAPNPPDPANASVLINADPIVPQGMIVTCIDQAKQVNITNFGLVTVADAAGATDTRQ